MKFYKGMYQSIEGIDHAVYSPRVPESLGAIESLDRKMDHVLLVLAEMSAMLPEAQQIELAHALGWSDKAPT